MLFDQVYAQAFPQRVRVLVLAGMPRLAGIPGALIHGRYDVSGPPDTAWALPKSWPGSSLTLLDDAGHVGTGFAEAMVATLDGFSGAC